MSDESLLYGDQTGAGYRELYIDAAHQRGLARERITELEKENANLKAKLEAIEFEHECVAKQLEKQRDELKAELERKSSQLERADDLIARWKSGDLNGAG